ncbi:unnamed protein product [Pleuronectes platessa]|uniref:Uncharacterized protein n=1 Tax=Pleuronectes platessa TaxID=8262 RepID=A0A9N7TWI3_PLEPL|nr:unnamed protein product [Pleuronectes platessa]
MPPVGLGSPPSSTEQNSQGSRLEEGTQGEGVPEVRGRAAEGSRSYGGQMGSGDGQADGGSRPERPGRDINMEEVRKVWRSESPDISCTAEHEYRSQSTQHREPFTGGRTMNERCQEMQAKDWGWSDSRRKETGRGRKDDGGRTDIQMDRMKPE